MTKAAIAKQDRKSLGKMETPNKQKTINALAKTPNSAVKQVNTPKSGNKIQANGNASAKKGSPNGINKGKNAANEDEDDEDENESEDSEEEEDSDAEVDEEGSDAELEGEEEGDEEEDSENSDDDDDDDDSVLDESKDTTVEVKTEKESDDDDDDDEEDDDDEDDDDEEEEDDDSKKKKPAKQAAKKEKSAAEKAAILENSIYIGNLDFKLTKEDVENFLKEKLSPADLKTVEFLPNIAGRARGYCFATLANKDAVQKAMKLNGTDFHGRPLKVAPKTTDNAEERKFIRITNISNVINDGQILELLTSVIKLSEIKSYKRVRSNVFGTHGAVQLELVSDDSYKKVQKLNDKELTGRKIGVLETVKPMKSAKKDDGSSSKRVNKGGNQNRNKGNFQQRGNTGGGGGRYFKKNDGNRKRPGNNFGGNKFNKKQKKE